MKAGGATIHPESDDVKRSTSLMVKSQQSISQEAETIGAFYAIGSAIYNFWLMIKYLESEVEDMLATQGEWEGVDDEGQGDAFLSKFGSLFDSYSRNAVWFGLLQIFKKLLFSALIALLGNSFVQSTFFTVFHFIEVAFMVVYSPFNDRTKVRAMVFQSYIKVN